MSHRKTDRNFLETDRDPDQYGLATHDREEINVLAKDSLTTRNLLRRRKTQKKYRTHTDVKLTHPHLNFRILLEAAPVLDPGAVLNSIPTWYVTAIEEVICPCRLP